MTTPAANYVYAFNGWLFGGPGQGVQVLKVEGLEDLPDLRSQDSDRGFADGMFSGNDFLAGRTITFTLQMMNDSAGTMATYLAQLKTNMQYQRNGTGLLQMMLPGRPVQRINGRIRRRSIPLDPDYALGRTIATVQLFCPDPRIYDDAISAAMLLPGSNVGRVYNRVYPLVYTTVIGGTSGALAFPNTGNVTVYPTFTISGAVSGPSILNQATGQYLKINASLSATDVLVIDTDLRSITLNGNPARNLLDNASQWFGFPPGSTTVAIIADTNTSGSCVVAYRNGSV